MKVISIGSDKNLFIEGSPVRARMAFYGQACDELHIIAPGVGEVQKISQNVFLHPTGTTNPCMRIRRAVAVGKSLSSCDLITAQDPFEYGIAALRLGKKLGLPVELQVHTDIGSPYFGKGFSGQEIRNKLRMIGVASRLRRAASVRVVSERVAKVVHAMGVAPERISVLPMFVATDQTPRVQRAPSTKEKVILMVGRLEKEKDYPTALSAFARVHAQMPDAKLYIAHKGSQRSHIFTLARKYNLENAIIFLGFVQDLTPQLTEAHVFLHTSRYEGFCASMAEAALAEVPIVSTNVGIAGTVLRDEEHGHIVPVGDVQKIANALIDTLAHPQRAHERALLAAGVVSQLLLSSELYVAKLKQNWSAIKK
ncbi:MAG: glycosyltransferase family 4 protein [Candidatus Campbellbacteria bacterium]|nr:glycosyltransferase family 4 protein [Candidatus Campbellbacteria bacterium]